MSHIEKLNDCELNDIIGGEISIHDKAAMSLPVSILMFTAVGTGIGSAIGAIISGKKGATKGSWIGASAGGIFGAGFGICLAAVIELFPYYKQYCQ